MTEGAPRSAPGRLIFFEGPDGVGKSTLHRRALNAMSDRGPVRGLAFPGNEAGSLGELVYRVHHGLGGIPVANISPLALQVLHVAAHVDAIESRVRRALDAGETIMLDRFWWSTWVYGVVDGIAPRIMDELIGVEKLVWDNTVPTVGILVKRDRPLRPENSPSRFAALCEAYEELASRATHPVVEVVNDAPLPFVEKEMLTAIHSHLSGSD